MPTEIETQFQAIVDGIVGSQAPRKVIVAGPGTGKTTLFRKILQVRDHPRDNRLILTFINNLKVELDEALGELARVLTFHGYCRHLLHSRPQLRIGLSETFHYYPPLPSLIESDWSISRGLPVPKLIGLMRRLEPGDATDFFLERADYYDAVSFDDSVFRIYQGLNAHPDEIESYETLLIDEYQDFNRLEASLLALLATESPIVIAGDDDQALYSQLRSSSPEFIRARYADNEYEHFALPFCLRCSEVIVRAVGDIVAAAQARGLLTGRINKPYNFYPPSKAVDSARYPKIRVVETSVQNLTANYFGRYIAQAIDEIPSDEIRESHVGKFPTVLVIGPGQYLLQVRRHLENNGYQCDAAVKGEPIEVNRFDGLKILRERPEANLGWRILIEIDNPSFAHAAICASVSDRIPLVKTLADEFRERILTEAQALTEAAEGTPQISPMDVTRSRVKFTSFEGSKGLSAQHVFVVGLHEGDLPRQTAAINDLEVCKMIVAITRTRKQCHLIHARRWGNDWKRPSPFLSWIQPERRKDVKITKDYW
jgi:superfamily I DNA/RNA helicase